MVFPLPGSPRSTVRSRVLLGQEHLGQRRPGEWQLYFEGSLARLLSFAAPRLLLQENLGRPIGVSTNSVRT